MLNRYNLRRVFQLLFLIVAIIIIWQTTNFIAHSYCPYALVCFGARGLNQGFFFVFLTAIVGGLLIVFSAIFIGRRFCGYICPLGSVIEYLNFLNPWQKKIRRKRIPLNIEKKLRFGKYLVLIGTAVFAFFLIGYLYYPLCPVMLSTGSTQITLLGGLVLVLIIFSSILVKRFWCRYLCGYAALMNCFQFIGKILHIKRSKIYRNLEVCTDCKCCEYDCPMNIEITDLEYIEDFNCIYCLNCIKACPKDMCLTVTDKKASG